jgi:DNA repair protein RadA/Sms
VEPAADLAIVAAILSSLFNRPLSASTVVFGEVGLGGEIRPAMFPAVRLKEASMLGFKSAIMPAQPLIDESDRSLQTSPVRNIQEAQSTLFG